MYTSSLHKFYALCATRGSATLKAACVQHLLISIEGREYRVQAVLEENMECNGSKEDAFNLHHCVLT